MRIRAVYTRYADDLVFSFDERRHAGQIETIVRQVLAKFGFEVNERKTTLQDAKNGRIVINGLAIDSHGLHPTRRTKKKARAAAHQQNASSLFGLLEWQKCKLPSLFGFDWDRRSELPGGRELPVDNLTNRFQGKS